MGAVLGGARRSVTSWCRRHTIGGDGAVAARRRGFGPGEQGALGREQELGLIEAIRGRLPDQLGLDGDLWTRNNVSALVDRLYGLPLSPVAVGPYLQAWGLGSREPVERACALCADAVMRWLETDYPEIRRAAREHRAELCWLGRMRLHGVVPAADVVSAMSTRGSVRFMITTPALDHALTREFLSRLRGPDGRALHVVVDGSWTSANWPRRVPDRVVLHALPSCARSA